MRFCTNCVIPDTRPDLDFDEEGVCDACRATQRKHGNFGESIDWDARADEFKEILDTYRSSTPLKYDCIVPVSGGKDSFYQAWFAKEKFGLNPLLLCFEPTLPTEIGRQNLDSLNRMGMDLIHVKRNPIVYDSLVMEAFRRVGDMEWPNHQGIWTLPYQYAIAFDISLIIWGESLQLEYGGSRRVREKNMRQLDEDWINDFGCLNGLRPEDMVSEPLGISMSDMIPYIMPTKEQLAAVGGNKGCVGVFIGYYFKWDVPKHLEIIEAEGWSRRAGRHEQTYTDFEGLDCYSMHLHDYLKFCKFGFGRASDDASRDVRNGVIGRKEAVRLSERYDGKYPKGEIEMFCEHFDITEDEFDSVCDVFTNPAIFEMKDGKFVRDIDKSLVLKDEIVAARRDPWVDWKLEQPAAE